MTDREGCSLSEGVRYLDRDIETSTVGYFIEEDDKAIVLASSIYGINIPDSLCKDCMVIPKAYISETIVTRRSIRSSKSLIVTFLNPQSSLEVL